MQCDAYDSQHVCEQIRELRDSSRILRSLNVCDILFDYIYSHLIYINHFFNFTPWPSTILKPIQSSPVSFVEIALWTSVIAPPSENRGRCRIKNAPFEKTGRRKLVMRLQQKPFQKGILQILPECEHTHNRFKTWIDVKDNDSYRYIYI